MAKIISADDAINAHSDGGQGGGNDKEFSKFNTDTKYTVKVVGTKDFFAFYSYGIYKVVNSFVAKNESKKTENGFPIDNLTSWDRAYLYHRDKSEKFGDDHSQEAYKYKPELRYALGFFDLDSGERIVIDVSKKQWKTIRSTIVKYEKKLGKLAFEVSKVAGGTVALTPIIDMDEDLTDKQRKNFGKAPEEFKIEDFYGILYEADDDEMVDNLVKAGFDVSLIGLSADKKANDVVEEAKPIDPADDF